LSIPQQQAPQLLKVAVRVVLDCGRSDSAQNTVMQLGLALCGGPRRCCCVSAHLLQSPSGTCGRGPPDCSRCRSAQSRSRRTEWLPVRPAQAHRPRHANLSALECIRPAAAPARWSCTHHNLPQAVDSLLVVVVRSGPENVDAVRLKVRQQLSVTRAAKTLAGRRRLVTSQTDGCPQRRRSGVPAA